MKVTEMPTWMKFFLSGLCVFVLVFAMSAVVICVNMNNETDAVKSETASVLAYNRNIRTENEEMSSLLADENELLNNEAHKDGKIFAGEHIFDVN